VADFDVTIQLINAPVNTVIAASARDVRNGNLHHYTLEGARNFVWSVSPEYRVFQVAVGNTTVFGYAFPYDVGPGAVAFKTTAEALALYNQIFGLYPFETMTVVQADFDHGMEYSGLFFLSKAFYSIYDGTPSTFLVSIAAHETAHQWWYGLVGNDQALEPWLDEALCTYSEKLFYEKLYPASLDWWEKYRIAYYEPAGWVDSTIYNTAGYRPYRDAVYLNGANFLDELRALVGEEAFFSFLQDYLASNTGRLATADDFFASLREHSDADWSTLVDSYFQTRK
jgi:aminopeptidase N